MINGYEIHRCPMPVRHGQPFTAANRSAPAPTEQ
jgi:hypothetical protein